MKSKPKEGDLVTVALRVRENGLLSRTEITHVTPFFSELDNGKRGFMANDDDRNVHYFDDEGITWVRGHVADDSPEGKALIAAHALAPKIDPLTDGTIAMTDCTWLPVSGLGVGTLIAAKPNPKNELGE